MGQGIANQGLENLQDKYVTLVARAKEKGLNHGVLDASIPVVTRLERAIDEDEQVKQLLDQKGAFSVSALWNICGTRVGNARVTLRAQREQLAIDEANIRSSRKLDWIVRRRCCKMHRRLVTSIHHLE